MSKAKHNPVWARKRAHILASRYLELLVADNLPMREFFDRLLEHGNQAINAVLGKYYPELMTTPPGSPLPKERMAISGTRALYVPELESYLSIEWFNGSVTRADLSSV